MADYPALTEMGISDPEQIERYSLETNNNVDILRIIYKRKKGSLLHASKKFRFGRSKKMVVTDGGSQKTELIHEISPFVIKVTNELRQIVKAERTRKDYKKIIDQELNRLEEETNTRIAYIRKLLKELDG